MNISGLIGQGLASARPAAGVPGRLYYATDTDALSRDNGTTWDAWTPGGGGGGGAVAVAVLAEVVLAAPAATIDLTSIPGTHRNLRLMLQARATNTNDFWSALSLQMNNDSGTNYDRERASVYGTTSAADESLGVASAVLTNIPSANAPAGDAGIVEILIANYAGATFNKDALYRSGQRQNTGSNGYVHTTGTLHWRSTAAITRLTFALSAGSFAAGTVATLYGEATA